MMFDPMAIAIIFVCLMLGGIIKGATGAGAPLFAVPAMTALFDVKLAIIIMIVPNLVTNIWQSWSFRNNMKEQAFLLPFLIAAAVGVVVGTWALTIVSDRILAGVLCVALVTYLILRFAMPDWSISPRKAKTLAFPAGLASGALQGASGLSAPASITFLSAMHLPRPVFVGAISLLFVLLAALQLPTLWLAGLLDGEGLAMSAFAIIPVIAGMPIGNWLMTYISPSRFQTLLLILLTGIAMTLASKAIGLT